VRQRSKRYILAYRFERTVTLIRPLDRPQIFTGVSDTVYLAVDVESLLGVAEVSALDTTVPVRKGRNI